MKCFITFDENGIDGFGFNESDKLFRFLRAKCNEWRGMKYKEIEITREDAEKAFTYFNRQKYKELLVFFLKANEKNQRRKK